MKFESALAFAQSLDGQDPLRSYRSRFHFPLHNGESVLYFCGNSLGLQPKDTEKALIAELTQWKERAIEGFFYGKHPWLFYHKYLQPHIAAIVGAKPEEVVVMNTLTTNLHLLMVSFYRPAKDRYKIIMEAGAFPSDQYAVESQVRWHGYDPDESIIEVKPREGEHTLHTEDILATIETHANDVALVLFGGVNYYTGQFYDLEAIAKAAHSVGAYAGFDLAHAAGNVPLQLHDWKIDFACWCSYKYLNSGPGGPGGVFINETHGNKPDLPRFAGWWGHDEDERFLMKKGFKPMMGAAGWQLSTAQVLSFAPHKVSLEMFSEIGMPALRRKSLLLTSYLEFLLKELNQIGYQFNIITPSYSEERGCQLSILTGEDGKDLFEYISSRGVIADWREPNVIRLAPVPLYNSFEDVWKLGEIIRQYAVP